MFAKIFNWFKKNYLLLVTVVVSLMLRLVNLGYSNYQGDEIKALYFPTSSQNLFEFLLDQRKGPIQFLITYGLKLLDPSYTNEFLVRLPFAIAGILSVIFFYKLVKNVFNNEKIAFYASFLMATNGFFIAFSRIVQYQSFVILFMIMALYFLQKKNIYIGLIFWAFSLLSHYDGVFIAPFAFYLIYIWFRENGSKFKKKLIHFILAGVLATTIVGTFYIPFVINVDQATKDYWLGRVSGEVSAKVSSSNYLFTVYQPIYMLHIYRILVVLGFGLLALGLVKWKFNHKLPKLLKKLPQPEKTTQLFYTFLWFLFALLFMEVVIYIPGTHIYTYLIPVFIFTAYGITIIESLVTKVFKNFTGITISTLGILLIFSFTFAQSYMIFVDNHVEYPWEQEKFLIWTFPKPTPIFHLSMFGFPYYRNWEGIADFVNSKPEVKAYGGNERPAISRYYIKLKKSSEEAGFYIFIHNPQSFNDVLKDEKVLYWSSNHMPEYVFSKNGIELVEVYLMPTGPIDEIKLKYPTSQ